MPALPTGTVTFLFTDIEGSTELLQKLGDQHYASVLDRHRRLLRTAFEARGGHEIETQGDGFLVAFQTARDAVNAAVEAQLTLKAHPWPNEALRVRMGLHTGEPIGTAEGYAGLDVHRAARICQAGWGGQILISQTTGHLIEYDAQVNVSLRDMGAHRLKDLQSPERIFQILGSDLQADFPPLRSLDILPNNLPVQLTSFIGREREIAAVRRLMKTTRLLTLTGVGGSGKTRLALQVAADLSEDFGDGIWLVELAALADSTLVPQAVASALNVREQPGRLLMSTLIDHLKPKRLLLVVDNCEHLVGACAALADTLLHSCSALRILATSRELLSIQGEMAYSVPPLSLPDVRRPSLDDLARSDAVRLFVQRAVSTHPDFTVQSTNTHALALVCHRLDGNPLAIELAAARIRILSVHQIVSLLDDRFRLLTGGGRTTLPRHQTLRAAIDWSHELLSEEERILFRRLSVFLGGWTLEAAEAVCSHEGLEKPTILTLVSQLVDKSLVVANTQNGEGRQRLLETVRQYARDKLRESDEEVATRARHSQWYITLAERAEPELRGREQTAWLTRLDSDHDNLRAALEWLTGRGEAEAALRLANSLWRFWFTRSYYREGRGRLEEILRRSPGATPSLRANALSGAGYLALNQEDYGAATALLEESLAIRQRLEDQRGIADALNWLGVVAWRLGDFARAAGLYTQGLALSEEVGAEDVRTMLLNSLALLSGSRGDYGLARALLEECLAIYRRKTDKWGIALTAGNLAVMAFRQGDHATARFLVTESLDIFRELGDVRGKASDLQMIGILAAVRGQPERAALILGAVEAARETVGAPFARTERVLYDYERHVALIQGALGADAFAKNWAAGRAMSLEEAVDYALREDPSALAAPESAG